MEGQRYASSSVRKITELGLQKSSAKVLPAYRTVLFTSRAGIGKMAILQRPAATNQGFQSLVLKDGTDPYFIYSMGEKIKDMAEGVASGSTFLEISGKMLGNLEVMVPTIKEQEAVATFFRGIDDLITLHQRKSIRLRFLVTDNFPSGAFSWEQRKLGDSFEFLQNNTLSRAELSTEAGAALNVHYGDVLIKFGEYLDASSEQMAYIPDQSIVDKFKGSLLSDGDVIMADTAEDETVGKCSEIAGLQGKAAISGLHTIPLRPVCEFAPGFLGYYMNSGAYHDQLLPLMQGIKVTSVSKNAIRNTDICYPSDTAEQALIGQYFIRLDHLITLHQREQTSCYSCKIVSVPRNQRSISTFRCFLCLSSSCVISVIISSDADRILSRESFSSFVSLPLAQLVK